MRFAGAFEMNKPVSESATPIEIKGRDEFGVITVKFMIYPPRLLRTTSPRLAPSTMT